MYAHGDRRAKRSVDQVGTANEGNQKGGAEPGTIGEAPRGHNLIIADLSEKGGVMYDVGAVRLCPKGDPKGLGCSTPKGSERSITW